MRILQRPVPAAELLMVLSFTLLACKLGKSKDDPESRELPIVDAAAPTPTPATPPATPQVPVPVPEVPTPTTVTAGAAVTTGSAVKPATTTGGTVKPATTTGGTVKPATTTGSVATTSTTGSAATTTGTAQAGTTGAVTVSPQCLAKCADGLSKCLSETQLGDNVALKCRRAFQLCQRECR